MQPVVRFPGTGDCARYGGVIEWKKDKDLESFD